MEVEKFDLVLTPNKSLGNLAGELWRYRDLFYFLAWRDFKVRYKQTLIGVLWAFLRPLLTMLVFTVIFGAVAGLPAQDNTPYAIMVFAAMLPWFFFASSFSDGSNSLVANSNMISKVYFPRIIIPVSALFVNFIDFCISFFILILLMVYFQFVPSANVVFLPFFLLLLVLFSVGAVLWMAGLNVKYRDVRYIIPFVIQFGMYVSPVGFSSSVVANQWRFLYSVNPVVGIIDGFRWCILGSEVGFYWPSLFLSLGVTLVLLSTGYMFFSKSERKFADMI